jgi:hypothetical protein
MCVRVTGGHDIVMPNECFFFFFFFWKPRLKSVGALPHGGLYVRYMLYVLFESSAWEV